MMQRSGKYKEYTSENLFNQINELAVLTNALFTYFLLIINFYSLNCQTEYHTYHYAAVKSQNTVTSKKWVCFVN